MIMRILRELVGAVKSVPSGQYKMEITVIKQLIKTASCLVPLKINID